MTSDPMPGLDALVEQARHAKLSWSGLAELLLREAHGSASHQPDTDRARRCGFGEVIFGSGKTPADVVEISQRLLQSGQSEVLVTRLDADHAQTVCQAFRFSRYDPLGRTLRLSATAEPAAILSTTAAATDDANRPALPRAGVAVVTAGSTDIGVAREAVETLHWMGIPVSLTTDVGVAGPYRLLAHIEHLRHCVAVVVVAGMEGALASVVGGLVPCPVIAVPTSVGYGANFEGITTLLSMLASCAAGVTAVNIDAGFKGGYIAGLIAAPHQPKPTTSSAAQ